MIELISIALGDPIQRIASSELSAGKGRFQEVDS